MQETVCEPLGKPSRKPDRLHACTGNVEAYATVADIIEILYLQIASYENQHRASQWLMQRYKEGAHLYGYVLKDVTEEENPFPYPKGPGIGFYIRAEGTP